MKKTLTTLSLLVPLVVGALAQVRFDDVIRNLRNPDPKARLASLEVLRESRHVDAVGPIAPLVNDPVDAVQLSAIETELSFFAVEAISARKRFAFVVEVRNAGKAESVFAAGPLAIWPRPITADLASQLLKAVDDDNARVRVEAIYTYGAIARPPASTEHGQQLIAALDHYDPVIRAAAARVIGRLEVKAAGGALIKAVNDSQESVRFAAMRALGEIRDETAVQALTQQLEHYRRGEGAWSALDALARIAHPSSAAVFKTHLTDRDQFLRRAAAEGLGRVNATAEIAALEASAAADGSEMVRAAMSFALQTLGRNYVARLAGFLGSDRTAPQIAGYFLELGPTMAPQLAAQLKDPNESVRGNVALILGLIGSPSDIAQLQPLLHDRNRDVVRAAERAIQRIKMRQE